MTKKKHLVEKCAEGTFIYLTESGKRLPLLDDLGVTLENLAGSNVNIKYSEGRVIFQAQVPESKGALHWIFDTNEPLSNEQSLEPISREQNLESLLYRTRVALNGRL